MYPVSVKAVLLNRDGKVVLLLNEREEWELPGGQIQPGESSVDALCAKSERNWMLIFKSAN